jgi:hypothetical protein
MGRTDCTEPQCLYKGDLYLLPYLHNSVAQTFWCPGFLHLCSRQKSAIAALKCNEIMKSVGHFKHLWCISTLVVFKSVSWYSNSSRGIEISFVVFKSVSLYLNPSRGIQTRNVVIKSGSWYSNSSCGIQIRLVAFKFVSWWANSS